MHVPLLPVVVVLVASTVAAVTDVRTFRIPNWLSLPLLFSGILYHSVNAGVHGLGASLLGALVGFGLLLPFFIAGGMGAGDVKLMAAVGAWLGMALTLRVLVVSSLGAGAYSLIVIATTRRWAELKDDIQLFFIRAATLDVPVRAAGVVPVQVALQRTDRRSRLVPFGLLISLALVITLVYR
jgi:prepilin peptidase CpaA